MTNGMAKKPKTGGRKKGTPNKATTEFRALVNLSGFILPNEIVTLYRDTDNEFIKLKLLELMAQYSYPKPKGEEPDHEAGEENDNQVITIADVLNIVDVTPGKKLIE